MKQIISFVIAFALSAALLSFGIRDLFGPVDSLGTRAVMIVPQDTSSFDIPADLARLKLIRSEQAFRWFMGVFGPKSTIVPGGYRLDSSMTAWTIVSVLSRPPAFVWITVREGLRKEQIGEYIGAYLGWNDEKLREWNGLYSENSEYREGVYFPDTYLLPTDEPVADVARRFTDRFQDVLRRYEDDIRKQNMKWTTVIRFASLLEREAAGAHDMPLIAGIIWNRIGKDMRLDIDATLQYIKGNAETGWWPRVVSTDKFIDSPYNTYMYKGLPPGPISNPGSTAIDAVLHPEDTECLFYLHAPDREIHCAVTYDEHKENIRTYLQ